MLPQPRVLAALLASVAPAGFARADAAADVFAELFGEQRKQVRATASRSDDVELAEKMLETARTVQDDTLVILLCDSAYELTSTTSKGYQTAADAMRLLAGRVPSRGQRCREKLLSVLPRLYANSRDEQKAAAGRAFAQMLEQSADEKVEAVAYYQRYLEQHQEQDLSRTRAELMVGRLKDRLVKLGPQIIDLLSLVDPERDAAIGQWSWVDGKLQCQPIEHGQLLLPVVIEGSYEFYFQFCRLAGNEAINPLIPVGGYKCAVMLGGWGNTISGLTEINGKFANENETTVRTFRIRNGLMYSVLISVALKDDRAQIAVVVNNKPLIRWQGPPSALGFRPTRDRAHLRARTPGMPTLGAWMNQANFHVAKLKVRDGKATTLTQDRQVAHH